MAAELAVYANGDANLAYGFSKVLLVNYTKAKTLEFAAQGCRVVTVSPGAVLTEVMNAEMENEATKQFVASIPVGRVGQPEDIAYLCDFLASDRMTRVVLCRGKNRHSVPDVDVVPERGENVTVLGSYQQCTACVALRRCVSFPPYFQLFSNERPK